MTQPTSTPRADNAAGDGTDAPPRVGVVQDGSRRHYQVPISLRQAGLLDRVFTDWYAPPKSAAWWAARAIELVRPAVGKRLRERYRPALDGVPVHSAIGPTILSQLTRGRYPTDTAFFEATADRFATWLLRGRRLEGLDAVVGFVRNLHPRAATGIRRRGLRLIADQIIAPAAVEAEVAAKEADRWPGWEGTESADDYDRVGRIERATWAEADHLVCGSEYVKAGMVAQGLSAEKVTVIPYTVVPATAAPDREPRTGPITVGFVGAVGLRKGTPYFFATAKRFDPARVRFVMVGRVHLDPAVAAREKGPVELVGSVPRSGVKEWLKKFDVFFFPSACEGSAGAVVEALMEGLPVVTSPSSGTTVRDGIEGYVAEYDDVDRYAACIERLAADPDLRSAMGRAARTRAAVHDAKNYADELGRLIREVAATH